ncbi:response regulator [Trinickia acidisoli]|uniref:response regulator n=1 Tax=Trinickia acidisoli TaxID=2767482 RepID=UPI001A9047F9|nr:response regulator [Trinickia acidisoli]
MSDSILIVDDSLTVRSDLCEALASDGYTLHACSDLARARAVLAHQPVDLIVLDVLLPDGDGIEWLHEIRATPVGADVPVLILSTETEVSDRIRGLTMGSNDYVGKPYNRDYLAARVRDLLRPGRESTPRKPSVLIVDDSVTFREHLGELLRAQNFDVLHAATGEEGLRSVALHRPSVAIVDGVLPDIDGPTLIRKLRLDAALRNMPCILLTGSSDRRSELVALEAGADAYMLKSEAFDMVLARVSAVLRNVSGEDIERRTASLLSPKRVLAADDSSTYLEALGETLRAEGYDTILTRSGEEALEMACAQAIDCILLDRVMPGLGGVETCRRIKASAQLRDVPVIMLTASEDQAAMIEGLSSGADDYVLKSSEIEVLKARVRVQLRRKQLEDQNRAIRSELMSKELEAAEARAARALAESRAELLSILEQKNRDLAAANETLQESQRHIAEKNRQLEAASRLKSEFLANMSHELRTPLNAIIGFSEVMRIGMAGPMTAQQVEFAGDICESGKHLLSMINDILDLSKIEAGRMTLELEPTDMGSLLQGSLVVIKERAMANRLMLKTEIDDIGTIRVDRRKTKQIVYNLLSNAVKFTPDAGTVTLRAKQVDRSRLGQARLVGSDAALASDALRFVEISVIDTGIGIDAKELPRLFQSFVQLDSSLARRYDGTGLGLALVKQLVELHGGALAVDSCVGQGSEFTVWLPIRAT